METSKTQQVLSLAAAVAFTFFASLMGYWYIGIPPVVIVGGSGVIGMMMWYRTYLKHPTDPKIILPLFLLTVTALEIHMIEEYLTAFGPAMSRLFDISWTERSFLLVFAFTGPILYTLTAIGLYYRFPFAGFLAWFIFIGPGVAEFTHFIFPLLQPAIEPHNAETISQTVSNGSFVANMPNYYFKTTGTYYFSGMYTAILPMIPGILAIYKVVKASNAYKAEHGG
ncbi:MAG: hypothetical protein AB7J13_06180 [Pyrinomonadaceae bacterium]